MPRAFAKISFTPAVLAIQERQGSAENYEGFLAHDTESADRLGSAEMEFITTMDGFFQATVSENGWPYVQFKGGPKGFLKVLDDKTIAYADFRGNRQYLSTGNLAENDRISIILMDYPNRKRLKIWGRVKLVETSDNPLLIKQLQPENYRAFPERAVVITVEAIDWNCPQHIPQRMTREELEPEFSALRDEITRLKQELSQ
ncbi:MAG: pyridoxamine 5'-phosphate oxidase family protein [Rhizobiales bacterium]|nr:pyridoxamine 5'-phosphate oxidase family protein [Hyphomicrobiales bacterium]